MVICSRRVATSEARSSPNARLRVSSWAVVASSVPWLLDRRTSDVSSSGERAEASSSWGSTPNIRRRTASAQPLSRRITGAVDRVNPRWNPDTARAVRSGCDSAMFLGTSSPNTMVSAVASTSARVRETDRAAASPRPTAPSGPRSRAAIEGSATNPTARLVTVMPSWAPDSWVDSVRRAARTPAEPWSPSATWRSTVARSTVTRENSNATNAAHAAIRPTPTRTSSHSITTVPPRGDGQVSQVG